MVSPACVEPIVHDVFIDWSTVGIVTGPMHADREFISIGDRHEKLFVVHASHAVPLAGTNTNSYSLSLIHI